MPVHATSLFYIPRSPLRVPRSALRAPRSPFRAPRSKLRAPRSALRAPRSPFRIRHSALTLLEMLLVLAVLAAALAILYPATERLYRTYRFQQAVEEIRGKLAATRVRAIDDGAEYQFRYEPDGRRLLVMPHRQTRPTHLQEEADRESPPEIPLPPWRFAGELPKGMRFGDAAGIGERLPVELLNDFPQRKEIAAAQWSPPVLFFPDGSATDATIELKESSGHIKRLTVRGLTGAASVDKSRREKGVDQP